MKIEKTDNTCFNALPAAKIKVKANGKAENYTIFNLSRRDQPFLEDLYKSTNLYYLMPDLTFEEYDLWEAIFRKSLKCPISKNNKAILLADSGNHPCGILNYQEIMDTYEVKRVCTWPVNPEERKLLAGKAMFLELFRRIISNTKKAGIHLEALKGSAFNPIKRYLQLGFQVDEYTVIKYQPMSIDRQGILENFEKYRDLVQITKLKKQPHVNLRKTLTIQNK